MGLLLAGAMTAMWLLGSPLGSGPISVALAAQDCDDDNDNDGDSSIDEDGVPCDVVLTGKVTYLDGTTPVSGASVTLLDTDTNATYATTSANSSGNFIFHVRAGSFTATSSYDIASTDSKSTSPATGSTSAFDTMTLGTTTWAYCDSIITTNCVQSVNKDSTTISANSLRLETKLASSSSLQMELRGVSGGNTTDASGFPEYDLTDFGHTTSDTFEMKVKLKTFTPKGIMGSGNPVNWSYDSGTKVLTVNAKPLAASYSFLTACNLTVCAQQADVDFDGMLFMAATDFSDAPASASAFVSQFEGGYIFTNASFFQPPSPDQDESGTVAVKLGGPHLKKSGAVNTGFYKMFWPNSTLQNTFGFTDLSDVTFQVSVISGGSTSTTNLSSAAASNGSVSGVILEASNFEFSVNTFNLSKPANPSKPAEATADDEDPQGSEPDPSLDTAVVATLDDLRSVERALERAFGADVQIRSNNVEMVTGGAIGEAVLVPLGVDGELKGPIQGDLDFTLGPLSVSTVDGRTLATIDFGGGMSVTSGKVAVGTEGGIHLLMEEPKLNFQPSPPSPSSLAGGDPAVANIGASFALEFADLPAGASLKAEFAKDVADLLANPTGKFQQLAASLDGQVGDLASDVAFGVAVEKLGISNEVLGANRVTLEVSKKWYDARVAEGKAVLIAKFDDFGSPLPPPVDVTGTATSEGDSVFLTSEFTGSLGGLSVFALVAMSLPPAPAAVPPPTPAPEESLKAAPAEALAPLMDGAQNLVRMWHFDPAEQNQSPDFGWSLYDPRPSFASASSVSAMVPGQFYWIHVRTDQTAVLGGRARALVAGWNAIIW